MFVLLVESAQGIFGKHKVSLVRVVFYWSSQNDVAVLQGRDIGTFNKRSLILILVQKVVPKVVLWEHLGVTKDYQAVFGSCECDIESPRVIQESNTWCLVTPDAWEQNEIFFSSLETIDRGNLNLFIKLRIELSMSLHIVHDEGSLPLIRCNNTDLFGSQTGIEHGRDNLLNVLCLFTIQERGAWSRDFFIAYRMVKEHWLFNLWPWELKSF